MVSTCCKSNFKNRHEASCVVTPQCLENQCSLDRGNNMLWCLALLWLLRFFLKEVFIYIRTNYAFANVRPKNQSMFNLILNDFRFYNPFYLLNLMLPLSLFRLFVSLPGRPGPGCSTWRSSTPCWECKTVLLYSRTTDFCDYGALTNWTHLKNSLEYVRQLSANSRA